MTHIIGWKNSRSIFISGDSAITSKSETQDLDPSELKSIKSVFGEEHVNEKKRIVQESALKLFNINDELIIAYAGKVHVALDIIDAIKKDFEKKKLDFTLEEIITEAVWLQKFPKRVSLIAGFYEGEKPILLSYNHNHQKKFVKHETVVTIGGLDEIHTEASLEFSKLATNLEAELTDQESLIMVNAAHQSMIILSDLIKEGVGGFFTGLYINPNGISWQKDTSYITFDINPTLFFSDEEDPNLIYTNPAFINFGIRGDKVAIASPHRQVGTKIQGKRI